jgi:steroid delta-isomerase-like uncharacterized protein
MGSEEEQNKHVVRQFFEVLNRQDTERMGQLVSTTNFTLYFSGMSPMDWNGSMQFIAVINNAFPDASRNIEDIVAEGDKAAVRLNVTGTHKGEFQGIPPTGKKVSFTAMAFLTIIDGKVEEERTTADIMGLMQQIGAIPGESHASGTSTARS